MSDAGSVVVSVALCWKNSAGSRRVVPYTSSVALHRRSSLRAVRIPRRTSGSDSVQWTVGVWALRDALSCQWNLSMIPLAIGW